MVEEIVEKVEKVERVFVNKWPDFVVIDIDMRGLTGILVNKSVIML